ncbi:alpha/beta hydrolase [Streptomyces sp. NBC_00006]|uniref:alpha/beta fold hydrolase n=1 Tax=unclassified Streptomyces TaxID=2593676 RepID=UPI00225A3697|nr:MULTISPECIES: alpha/beta hydrolase [unclassified Streptomyces]MCX5533406.1 alpha/beta hydrolase [Streptomyces sp. NBC_00006]
MPYATANDTTLHYEDLGSGRPLVFLHGWGTSGRVWDAQAADLAADHRVITLDWRGCGRSDRPASGYTIDQLADDALEFIDVLGLEQPVLVGSSIAGAFVIEAALRAPERIGAIVPVDSGVQHFSTRPEAKQAMAELVEDMRADRAGTLAGFVPHWYAPGTSAALIEWTVRQVLDATPRIDGLAADQAEYDPRERLPALRVPTHFLHGELDSEVPLSVPRELLGLIPGARLTVIEGAGHMAQQERPDSFNQALRAVLN